MIFNITFINSMYKGINSLENKMKKQYFTKLLFGFLLLAGTALSSCSNEESSNEEIESGTRTITFDLGQGFEESENETARGISEKTDTIRQTFCDGMELTAFIQKDKVVNSRVTESVEIGTKVLAIVVDENDKICKMEVLEVDTNHKLICKVPNYRVRIIFLSNNDQSSVPSISLTVGDYISSDTKTNTIGYNNKYIMIAQTASIDPGKTSMGTVRFKHAFARTNFGVGYIGVGVTQFVAILEAFSNESAQVNINTCELERNMPYRDLYFSAKQQLATEKLYTSGYQTFIPRDDTSVMQFTLNEINGTTINLSTKLRYDFKPGYSYTIYIQLRKRSRIVDGWTNEYYQWDAMAPFTPGTTPVPGNASYYNTQSNIPTNSCKYSLSPYEIRRMSISEIYWDDYGPEWIDYKGQPHTTGMWIKQKNSMWPTTGSPSTPLQANDAVRESDDFIFFPASGYIEGSTVKFVGERGFYWSNERGDFMSFSKYVLGNDSGMSPQYGMSLWHLPQ